MPELFLTAPLSGLSDDVAFGEQPPRTTRDAKNVRSICPITGRTRIAQRPGLSKYLATQIHDTAKVALLEQVIYNNLKVTYSLAGTPSTVFSNDTPEAGGAYSIQMSPRGDVYVLARPSVEQGGTFWRYNQDGVLLSTTTVPIQNVNDVCWTFFVDEYDDVWVGVGSGAALDTPRPVLFRFALKPNNTYGLKYTLWCGTGADDAEFIRCIYVKDGILYTLQSDMAASAAQTCRMRSYRDIYNAMRPEFIDLDLDIHADIGGGLFQLDPNDMVVNKAGGIIIVLTRYVGAVYQDQYLIKYTAMGVLRTGWTKMASAVGVGGGMESSVQLDSNNNIFTMGGPHTNTNFLRHWLDAGATLTADWAVTDANNTEHRPFHKIRVDEFNNVHVPFPRSISGAWDEYRIYSLLGALVKGFNNTSPSFAVNNVAIPPTNPEYDDDVPNVPEFVWLVGSGGTIRKLRLADVVAKAGSTRTSKMVSVAGGEIRTFDATTLSAVLGNLSATAEWIMSAVSFGKVYFTDGVTYLDLDPVAGTVVPFLSQGSSTIPPRCLLMVTWRGRMVLARDPDDVHNWHMSAAGDVYDWDQLPPVITSTTAVSGNNAEQVGRIPDAINCLISYSDDILIFGCDHSIYMIRGDPMAGGTLDLVSDSIGMSFGAPWCRDPEGRIYFFGSRGGIYAMDPHGSQVVSITRDNIERRMLGVDLEANFVRLAWNWRDNGLHVFVFPYGAGGTLTQHWFLDGKNRARWEDEFGTAADSAVQPTAVYVSDGDDPNDRVLILGTNGGYALKWDAEATNDDGTAIDALVLYGPFQGPELTFELKVLNLTAVLSDTQGWANYEFFVNDRPDVIPTLPAVAGVLQPGRNPRLRVGKGGMSVWMKLRNNGANSRFAVEHITANYRLGGRMRVKS